MKSGSPPYRPVPPEEARKAAEDAANEDAKLEAAAAAFLGAFGESGRVYEFTLLPQIDVAFRAYIFFESDAEAQACRTSGLLERMRTFLTARLTPLDDQEEDLLALEIDSHANVVRAFDGSYFLRLRSKEVQEQGKRTL
jgi:hypothetical protein